MADDPTYSTRATVIVLLNLVTVGLLGCRTCDKRYSPDPCRTIQSQAILNSASGAQWAQVFGSDKPIQTSEVPWPSQGSHQTLASKFLEFADTLSAANDPRCPDYYFQAALHSWQAISAQAQDTIVATYDWRTYHASLAGLVTESIRFGRLDQGRLRIYRPYGPEEIDVIENGLLWPTDQFSELRIAKAPKHHKLKNYYCEPGIGVPVVATRASIHTANDDPAERFFPSRLPVALTALLRPRNPDGECRSDQLYPEFVLELVNPLRIESYQVGQQPLKLASDISAPLEEILNSNPSNPLSGFVLPGAETQDDGLKWLEPYQPGKIPVVFIHGLLSDPTTWLEMVNYLRTQNWFNQKYQVWGFSYATGSPFVTSAYRLRHQLLEALSIIEPHFRDPALGQMVLIGHSMGGLVAKLQVAESGNAIWNSISRVPFDSIQASEEVKQQLSQRLFFAPQPHISRVIYIATPHAGSSLAIRGIGRISSALVRPEDENRALHEQLIKDNPDAFFGTFRNRIPTSIDLLDPDDATLQAIYGLPVSGSVEQHNILGTGNRLWTCGQSDGVVTINSAGHPDCITETHIAAPHTEITKDEATFAEVARILKLHLN